MLCCPLCPSQRTNTWKSVPDDLLGHSLCLRWRTITKSLQATGSYSACSTSRDALIGLRLCGTSSKMPGLRASRHAPGNSPVYPRPTQTWVPAVTVTLPPGDGGITNSNRNNSSNSENGTNDPVPLDPADSHINNPRHHRRPSAAKHELARYSMIRRRLEWKLEALERGYEKAVDRVGRARPVVDNANIMFKLDFFEYYMLIERALVHLLGVFGVDVPRDFPPAPTECLEHRENKNDDITGEKRGLEASRWSGAGGAGSSAHRHRYHANVLAALDREDNPLHAALGTGEVRRQLQRAKDLRNRWKTAGSEDDDDEKEVKGDNDRDGDFSRRTTVSGPLESYNLGHMLRAIFEGFDEAYRVAEQFVRTGDGEVGHQVETEMVLAEDGRAVERMVLEHDEAQWEFMVDAMDWEAV
ncbi:hypothetical protein VTK26DRAFT_7473 [Humicola hyalothermophila]